MAEIGGSIEQEIAQLEKQLQEKRAALEQAPSIDKEAIPSEKETFREVVTEQIQQHAPQYVPPPVVSRTDDDNPSYLSDEIKDKVQELVNTVFNKSLDEGIKEAVASNNAALIDAFHDVLVDELYDALLERKKVEPVS